MAYNAETRKNIIWELENYGSIRDGSGRAVNLLINRMNKHGVGVRSKPVSIRSTLGRMAQRGEIKLNAGSRRTYSIELVKDPIATVSKPLTFGVVEPKAEPKTYEPQEHHEILKLKRKLVLAEDTLKAKDQEIVGLRQRIRQLETNLAKVCEGNRVGYDPAIEIDRLMREIPRVKQSG